MTKILWYDAANYYIIRKVIEGVDVQVLVSVVKNLSYLLAKN